MSMSIQLEASDDQVVSYLKTLWNNSKQLIQEEKNLDENAVTNNSTTEDKQTKSIIQQLIDSNILNPATQEQYDSYNSNTNNQIVTSQPKYMVKDEHFDNLPETTEQTVQSHVAQLSQVEELAVQFQIELAEPKEEHLIQKDYIDVTDVITEIPEISNAKPIDPIIIQLENKLPCSNNKDAEGNLNIQIEQVGQDEQVEQVEQIVLDTNDKTKFRKQVKENLNKIREIGFRVYHDIGLEKEVNIVPSSVTNGDINKVFDFKVGTPFSRKSLMGDIARCVVFAKHKSGDTTKPENFRYLVNHHNTVKILDRIWCSELIGKCGVNLPDKDIYKSTLVKTFNGSIISTAIENTKSFDNVVMVDIMKAFDSLNWDVLEELMLSNLTRKTNKETATELVSQYMTILKNRELYWNNIRIEVSKGIPTGLPSSNLVFTLAIEEILFRWFKQSGFTNGKEFMINVYVDDIYLRIIQVESANEIFNSLIEHLAFYKFTVNKNKTKADKKLEITGLSNHIEYSDYYLGIPFTRDINLYGELILSELNKKIKVSWLDVYDIITDEESSEEKSRILGFLNYKLKPFYTDTTKPFDKNYIGKFVLDNYAKEPLKSRNTKIKQMQHALIAVVVLLSAVTVTLINSGISGSKCYQN